MQRLTRRLAATGIAALAFGSALDAHAQERMSLATGSSAGVYYLWGGALAKVWSEQIPDVSFNVEATAGQVPNVRLLEAGELEASMYNIATAYEAWNAIGDYSDREYRQQRAIFAMYPSYYVMTALKGSGISSIEDWEGKRVSFGTAGGTVDVIGRNILDTLGIEPDEIVNSGWADVPGQARDGLIDAIGAIGGQPWPPIRDLETTHDLVFYSVTDEQLTKLKEAYPYFVEDELPANTYEDMSEAYPTLAFWNLAVAGAEVPEDVVYQMTKLTFENKDLLEATHPSTARFLDPDSVLRVSPIPLHPGAIRYYEEIGLEVPDELRP
jgi:TRAP transporter TAXI family solute receptor